MENNMYSREELKAILVNYVENETDKFDSFMLFERNEFIAIDIEKWLDKYYPIKNKKL